MTRRDKRACRLAALWLALVPLAAYFAPHAHALSTHDDGTGYVWVWGAGTAYRMGCSGGGLVTFDGHVGGRITAVTRKGTTKGLAL